MRQVSLSLAVMLFIAACVVSPALASKCYGLDPCGACRNCHACKHCFELGGKCGVCKREKLSKLRVWASAAKNRQRKK